MNLFALLLATAGALTPITTTMGSAVSVSPKVPAADAALAALTQTELQRVMAVRGVCPDAFLAALTETELQRIMAARGVGPPDVPSIHEQVFRTAPLARNVWSYLGHDNMPTERDKYVQETTMPGAPLSDYPLLVCCPDGLSDLTSLLVAVSGSSTCSTPRFVSQMQAVGSRPGKCHPWRVRSEPVFADGIGGNMAKTAWLEAGPGDRDFWTVISSSGYSPEFWRTPFSPLHLYSPMKDLAVFDGDGNYGGKPNVFGTLSGGPKSSQLRSPMSTVRACQAHVLDAENVGVRSLADAPQCVQAIVEKLPPASVGRKLMDHCFSLECGTEDNMAVCVCLSGLQGAKLLAIDKFGPDAVATACEWLERECGVAENHVGDLYWPTKAMGYYLMERELLPRDTFFYDEACQEPVVFKSGFNKDLVQKGQTIYRKAAADDGPALAYKAVTVVQNTRAAIYATLIAINPPEGVDGPGFVGRSSAVEAPMIGAFGEGIDHVSGWHHSTILDEIKKHGWFERGPDEAVVMVVWRHAVGGDGGNILCFATNGDKVVSVATHLTEDLLRVGGEYPPYLLDATFLDKVLIGRAWASTLPPEERAAYFTSKVLSRSTVAVHEKMLAVALVASGAMWKGDLDWSNWLQLKEDSPISAADFHGVAYCTLHARVKKSEGSSTDDSTGTKDVAWYAELRAASERLSAAKALVQLSESAPKASFHADV